jgi:pyruvate/oxaloacetate carboxyltransferase
VVALESLKLGIDVLHTAISPLAHATSNPPTEMLAEQARNMGFDVRLDSAKLAQIAAHFRAQAIAHGKPIGQPMSYDPDLIRHQVPGGMRSNLEQQLRELGLHDRLPEVLEEIVRMREELGWPIMVSPMSQFIGVQALLNVVEGERYRTVQSEIRRYVLGWYGKPAAPVNPNILDQVGAGQEPISERPGALLEPMVDKFRKQHGPFKRDEDLILAMHFRSKKLDEWRAARKVHPGRESASTPVSMLVQELTKRRDVSYAYVQKGNTKVTYTI